MTLSEFAQRKEAWHVLKGRRSTQGMSMRVKLLDHRTIRGIVELSVSTGEGSFWVESDRIEEK